MDLYLQKFFLTNKILIHFHLYHQASVSLKPTSACLIFAIKPVSLCQDVQASLLPSSLCLTFVMMQVFHFCNEASVSVLPSYASINFVIMCISHFCHHVPVSISPPCACLTFAFMCLFPFFSSCVCLHFFPHMLVSLFFLICLSHFCLLVPVSHLP